MNQMPKLELCVVEGGGEKVGYPIPPEGDPLPAIINPSILIDPAVISRYEEMAGYRIVQQMYMLSYALYLEIWGKEKVNSELRRVDDEIDRLSSEIKMILNNRVS